MVRRRHVATLILVNTEQGNDDVIKWKHFPRYWPFVRGIHRSPVNSQHKGQWRGALMFSLICVWINGWENNREAGDLKRHRAHYDVIVMCSVPTYFINQCWLIANWTLTNELRRNLLQETKLSFMKYRLPNGPFCPGFIVSKRKCDAVITLFHYILHLSGW